VGKCNWMGLRAPVGHGGALVALDRGLEAVGAADDGGQGLRRRSSEGLCSGEENAVD
jgi:hypothetical protein